MLQPAVTPCGLQLIKLVRTVGKQNDRRGDMQQGHKKKNAKDSSFPLANKQNQELDSIGSMERVSPLNTGDIATPPSSTRPYVVSRGMDSER